MLDNRLRDDKLSILAPGDSVIFEVNRGWARADFTTGTVAKLTPKQIVVHYGGPRGTVEVRFRRADGRVIGNGYGFLLDPEHEYTVSALKRGRQSRRQQQIDSLAGRWSRERDNLDVLRDLQVAIGEYLDAES